MDQPAAVLPRRRPDVDDPVRRSDRLLVVLDHQQRVAEVAEPDQRRDQPCVVALVEADRRLVQDVEHAHQARSDLGRQPDALRLAAAQRPGRAVQGQVVEADVDQEAEPRADLLEHLAGDRVLALGQALRQPVIPGERIGHRSARRLDDVLAPDRHGHRLRLEPHPVAGRAWLVRHVALEVGAHRLRARLAMPAGQVRDDPLEGRLEGVDVAVARPIFHVDPLVAIAIQDDLPRLVRQVADRDIGPEAVVLRHRVEDLAEPALGGGHAAPRQHGALVDRELVVRQDEVGVDLEPRAETGAIGTGAVRRVEAEVARGELLEGAAVLRAGVLLAVQPVGLLRRCVRQVHDQEPLGQPQRRLDRVGHARGIRPRAALVIGLADDQPVDHDLDAVLVLLVELDLLVEVAKLAVHPHANEAGLLGAGQQLLVLALAILDQRRHQHRPRPLGQLVDLVDHLLHGLALDLATADRAVHAADAREQQAQVVVDLGDRPDRRARVPRGALLVDADGRAQPVDLVDVRLLHLSQELARVGGEALDVAALPLGVDGVEGKARLPRAGEAGDDDEPIAGHLHVDVLEVVLACAADDDLVGGHRIVIVAGTEQMRTPVRFQRRRLPRHRRRW